MLNREAAKQKSLAAWRLKPRLESDCSCTSMAVAMLLTLCLDGDFNSLSIVQRKDGNFQRVFFKREALLPISLYRYGEAARHAGANALARFNHRPRITAFLRRTNRKAKCFRAAFADGEQEDRLAGIAAEFLRLQVAAGASAVQLFDSWVGALPAADYVRYVQPHSAKVLAAVADLGVPRIHFGVGTGELLGLMGEAGADVVGVDFRVPLDEAARRVGPGKALQGNLDPAVAFAPWDAVEQRVCQVLADAAGLEGHLFNLGHGVLPGTDPDVLSRIVSLVHEGSLLCAPPQ